MNKFRRRVAGAIGALLLASSLAVLFESMWISAGANAFAEKWGGRLTDTLDTAFYRHVTDGAPLPTAQALREDLWLMAGYRATRIWIWAEVVASVSGVVLLLVATVPSRRLVTRQSE